MLPALRRARIIELLREQGAAELTQMSRTLGVSVSTLRRDVDYLCEQGHLERTRGGAVLGGGLRAGLEMERAIASQLDRDAKRVIGQRAAARIEPGQTVIFDSGTTTAAAARAARERGLRFTAITNDFIIAAILSERPGVTVLVAGGTVRPGTSTLLGVNTLQEFERLRADLAFIGAHAVSATEMSDSSIELAALKRAIMGAAGQTVLLAASSKFFTRAFCSFGPLSSLSGLITDDRLAPEHRAALELSGLQVELAPLGGHGEADDTTGTARSHQGNTSAPG